MDIKSKEARSQNMRHIKNKNTKPELYFRKLLFSGGFRYRVDTKNVPGHPDIFLRKYNAAVFIHGCFWHRHPECKYSYTPKTRVEFWEKKFSANQKRDNIVKKELAELGIRQLIIWECTIRRMRQNQEIKNEIITRTVDFFRSDCPFLEL